eukprot:1150127-Pelagomonas_calceolata.AAC.1
MPGPEIYNKRSMGSQFSSFCLKIWEWELLDFIVMLALTVESFVYTGSHLFTYSPDLWLLARW